MDQNQEKFNYLNRKLSTRDKVLVLSVFVISFFSIIKIQPIVTDYAKKKLLAQVPTFINQKTATVLPQEVLPTPPEGKVWILSFYDEFNGTTIDENKWNRLGDQIRRKETIPYGYWIKDNAYLNGNGQLVLRTDLDNTIPGYRSGALDTNNKFNKKFGYVSVKASFANQPGHWGAFWMMTGSPTNVDNSAQDGAELDIIEKPSAGVINIGSIWDGYGPNLKSDSKLISTSTFDNGYHEFGLDWQSDAYKFYGDGYEVFRSTGGGVSQKPGYLLVTDEVGSWVTNIANAVLPDYTYVDYVHVYEAVNKPSFTYQISPSPQNNYLDTGNELNNGKLALFDFRNQEWVGIVGQPKYYFEIGINMENGVSLPNQVTFHMLSSKAPGIYIPKKIELYCSGTQSVIWSLAQPSVDGLYQVILSGIPTNCKQGVFRLWNGWWTFLSEITIGSAVEDTAPPKIKFVSPLASTTISGSNVSISASALDNVGVMGVQFKLDGATGVNIGNEVTQPPYSVILDSTKYSNGIHKITATARDAAGNISVDVVNGVNINNGTVLLNNPTITDLVYNYSINSGAHPNYPDANGNELINGKLASVLVSDTEWTGVIGQPSYYFDIAINLAKTSQIINQVKIETMVSSGAGVYLPKKIQLLCGGIASKDWSIATPTTDGLKEIVLDNFPATCSQPVLRLWNGWWTFLSEIKVQGY